MAADVRIDTAKTDVEISEPIGPLSADEVRRLAATILDMIRAELERDAQLHADRAIRNRSYGDDAGTGGPWR